MNSMLKFTREKAFASAHVAANGTTSLVEGGLVAGATGVGSCTLSDTSLYTFDITGLFSGAPDLVIPGCVQTTPVHVHVVSISSTAIVVRGTQVADGATKVACIFKLAIFGKGKGL